VRIFGEPGGNVVKAFSVILFLALAGCSGIPQRQSGASPCSAGEAAYACQVERYQNVNAQ
jgi:hypothetical protein